MRPGAVAVAVFAAALTAAAIGLFEQLAVGWTFSSRTIVALVIL